MSNPRSSKRNPRTSSIRRLTKIVVMENLDCRTSIFNRWCVTRFYSDGTQEDGLSNHFPHDNEYENLELVYTGHRGGKYTWKLNRRRAVTLDLPQVDEDAKLIVLF